MVRCALMVRLEAKPGKEQEVEAFLQSALAMVEDEPETTAWFALKIGPHEFGIFDAFPDESGRKAHLTGKVAEALFAKDLDLLAREPEIVKIDVLAEKLPGRDTSRDLPDEAFAP
ncbi:MAG: antibiotic biosynthesis monooxygenase [Bdellovibrionales bacterium]|nr:antibiotic biosynthesis monooxygenase [Bdellovibrionales bacterium]